MTCGAYGITTEVFLFYKPNGEKRPREEETEQSPNKRRATDKNKVQTVLALEDLSDEEFDAIMQQTTSE